MRDYAAIVFAKQNRNKFVITRPYRQERCKHWDHGRIKLYRRPWSRLFRKEIYWACIGCGMPLVVRRNCWHFRKWNYEYGSAYGVIERECSACGKQESRFVL